MRKFNNSFIFRMFRNVIFVSFILFLMSCNKETNYKFEVNNNTEFHIDKLTFSCSFENKTVTVEPYSNIKLDLKYEQTFTKFIISHLFKEPELCYTIEEYSDSINQYKNPDGFAIDKRHIKQNELNILNINKNSNLNDTINPFIIELNEIN